MPEPAPLAPPPSAGKPLRSFTHPFGMLVVYAPTPITPQAQQRILGRQVGEEAA